MELMVLDRSGMTGSYPNTDNDDFSAAGRHASQHAGNSGDSNIFSNVLSLLSQRKNDIGNEDIDEQGQPFLPSFLTHPQSPELLRDLFYTHTKTP